MLQRHQYLVVNGKVCREHYNYGLVYTLEGCSDEVVSNNSSTGTLFDLLRASYQTDNAEIRQFWITFFAGISRCNTLIGQLDGETT